MNQDSPTTPLKRKPRILWASYFCLLDTSSGASMAVREMLLQLAQRGYEITILGATIFDAQQGLAHLQADIEKLREEASSFTNIADGPLTHQLLVTESIKRTQITSRESLQWLTNYAGTLHALKPDLVFYYGGQMSDWPIADEARTLGIPVAFYLANGNYHGTRWCRDVDLILTDSRATSELYHERTAIKVTPVGAFIDPRQVVATQQSRRHVLFINPSWTKGVSVLIMVALQLEKRRPDIKFEVIESRGSWQSCLRQLTTHLGNKRTQLDNVIVTSHTNDMRPVYGRSRLLMAPSLWWESSGRVLAEAMLNGIPAIITERGGMPEMIEDAGIKIQFDNIMFEKPYTHLPRQENIDTITDWIVSMYDNEDHYQQYVRKAYATGARLHSLEASTARVETALKPLLDREAGEQNFAENAKARHRHGVIEPQLDNPDGAVPEIPATKPR